MFFLFALEVSSMDGLFPLHDVLVRDLVVPRLREVGIRDDKPALGPPEIHFAPWNGTPLFAALAAGSSAKIVFAPLSGGTKDMNPSHFAP